MANKSTKNTFQDTIDYVQKNPAIAVTIGVGALLLAYSAYKQNAGTSPSPSTSNTPAGSYYVAYLDDEKPTAGGGTSTTPTPSPTPTGTTSNKTVTLTKAGSLETTPHDTNGGKNLA